MKLWNCNNLRRQMDDTFGQYLRQEWVAAKIYQGCKYMQKYYKAY